MMGRKKKSFKEHAEESEASHSKPVRHQEKISCYTGLTWPVIRQFLESKWPDQSFEHYIAQVLSVGELRGLGVELIEACLDGRSFYL